MKRLSRKALLQVPQIDVLPPCITTMRQVFLVDLLFRRLAEPALDSFVRPVMDIERATIKQARKADFVLVETRDDGFAYSFGSGLFEREGATQK